MKKISEKKRKKDYYLLIAKHSFFIAKLKLIILSSVFLLIIGIIVWPLTNSGYDHVKLSFGTVKNSKNEEKAKIVKPRFNGVDKDNQPYAVTADSAVQESEKILSLQNVNGDILFNDKSWISVLSKKGMYDMSLKTMNLTDAVNIFTNNGYEILTDSANLDLVKNISSGKEKVVIQGPLGILKADEFVMKNGEITFSGNIHLVAYPKSKKL